MAADYKLLGSGAGLLDRSQRGRLALTGTGAAKFLGGQVTNEIETLRPGAGCYAAFLTHKGKMLGDLRVLATGDVPAGSRLAPSGAVAELLLETERVALQGLFDMIRRFKIGYDVELHKRTLESSLLSLIGPQAGVIAARASEPARAGAARAAEEQAAAAAEEQAAEEQAAEARAPAEALPPPEEHAHRAASIAGRQVRLIATAAPEGIDVLCDSVDREAVQAALIEAGADAVSEAAAEIVRVEHGRPRYGVDLDESVIPQEAGLNERAVNFTKGCYVGQETVARLYYKGKPNRHLRGLRLSEPVGSGAEICSAERVLGRLASSVLSPRLGPIGLALVRREAEPGATLSVGPDAVAAQLVELPFAV